MLKFNPKKCKVLHVKYNENPMNSYIFDDILLDSVKDETDLGVWTDQVRLCILKTNQKIASITRVILLRNKEVILPIYKTVIRHLLEYCTQLWSPIAEHGNWALILELEGV